MCVLELNNVSYSYEKKSKEVLKDIPFNLKKEKYMRLQENQAEENNVVIIVIWTS